MRQTLEERVKSLEEKLASLCAESPTTTGKKDWRRTFGMSKDDPLFDEMNQLGREYRETKLEP